MIASPSKVNNLCKVMMLCSTNFYYDVAVLSLLRPILGNQNKSFLENRNKNITCRVAWVTYAAWLIWNTDLRKRETRPGFRICHRAVKQATVWSKKTSTNQALGAECLSWYTLSFETEERRFDCEKTVVFQQQDGQTGRRRWCPPQPLKRTNVNLEDHIMHEVSAGKICKKA